MTETFTTAQFENALPVNKTTKATLCESKGLVQGEYTYLLPIHSEAGVMIRSSIDASGLSAATGEDSIRLWLVDPVTLEPVGSKISKYITRTKGWQNRLVDQLRALYTLGKHVHTCSCGDGTVKILKVKKDGPTKGKLFTSCSNRDCKVNRFAWLADSFQAKKFQPKAA